MLEGFTDLLRWWNNDARLDFGVPYLQPIPNEGSTRHKLPGMIVVAVCHLEIEPREIAYDQDCLVVSYLWKKGKLHKVDVFAAEMPLRSIKYPSSF